MNLCTWALIQEEWPLCSDCDSRIQDFLLGGSQNRVTFEYDEFVEACEVTECPLCQAIIEACDQLILAGNTLVGPGWGTSQLKFITIETTSPNMLKIFWGATLFISIRKGRCGYSAIYIYLYAPHY